MIVKGIVKECRDRQYFEKPASIRNQKNQAIKRKRKLEAKKAAIIIEESKMSKWHGDNSKRRPSDEQLYSDNWERIFNKKEPEIKVRKVTPTHNKTQVHKDKTKVIPRKSKTSRYLA